MRQFRLEALTALAGWAMTVSAGVPHPLNSLRGSCPIDASGLGEQLSRAAKIYCPGSSEFETASTRWSALKAPKVNVVVVPNTEEDVAKTVSFS
jgi:hypothetical protein